MVEQKFGDSGNVQITRAMQLGWINNGIRAIAQQSPFLEGIASQSLLSGINTYDLTLITGKKMASIIQIVVNGKAVDLISFPQYQAEILNSQDYSNGVAQGVATGRPVIGTIFADQLMIWPTPQLTIASGLQVFYNAYPADLVAITDKITVPDRYYNALFDYVMAQALELDENFQASQIKMAHFQGGVQREYNREHSTPSDFYSGMVMDPYDDDLPYNPGSF